MISNLERYKKGKGVGDGFAYPSPFFLVLYYCAASSVTRI